MRIKIKWQGILYWGLFLLLSTVMCIALFGTLGIYEVNPTDEATHGVNAYEMIKNGNLWINTLRYEVDYYNTKPPLMLWLIILGYKLFGYTPLGMRFFSAAAGLMIYVLAFWFIYKVRGKMQAILFSAFLPACTALFNFHMFRSGDMDSVYTLCFFIAIIAIYNALKNITFLILYGIMLGLGFMCKATHAITFAAVGILFIPYIGKRFGWAKTVSFYLLSYLAALAVILPWAIVRVRFDGTAFFRDILFSETMGRVKGSASNSVRDYFDYTMQLLGEPICFAIILVIVIAVSIKLLEYRRGNKARTREGIRKPFLDALPEPYIYLLSAWFIVVVGAYSIAKAGLGWYIYAAYIPLIMLGAEALTYLTGKLAAYRKSMGKAMIAVFVLFSIILSINMIRKYPWSGSGGSPRIGFYDTVKGLNHSEDGTFSGRAAYIENGFNLSFEQNRWEHDYMFYAVTTLDVRCMDGGAPAFLETDDREAILLLDKTLWEEYAPVLTGYVILEDSGFLVFSKDKYGE